MSRNALCVTTAALIALASVGLMAVRHAVLGDEVTPTGGGTWKVTLAVRGVASADGRLTMATPLEIGRQHVLRETFKSAELTAAAPTAKHPTRRQVLWSPKAGVGDGPCRAHYEFTCATGFAHPTPTMEENAHALNAPPADLAPKSEDGDPAIRALAARLTQGVERPEEQVEAFFHFVDQDVANEPMVNGPAVAAADCLHNESGDPAAKSRLLIALCGDRGIPTRMVQGLALAHGREQSAHAWVEVWLHDRWTPMCPFYHHYGKLPRSYLVFGYGDHPLVAGRNVRDLDYGFLVERLSADAETVVEASWAHRVMTFLSFQALPPPEQRLVEFLLLLPIAALVVCIYRNLIGMNSFGTFAPALLGLSFRELHSLPGILVFVSVVVCGWLMRRLLDRYHLLQVPRASFMLSLVVLVLVSAIALAGHRNLPATRYVSLFPIIILTGMIERFWALENEDGTTASFRTLLATMLIAVSISLVLSIPVVPRLVFHYPEATGIIMAAQLLMGRYTGYRLAELYRFRHFLRPTAVTTLRFPTFTPPPSPLPGAERGSKTRNRIG